MLLNFLSIYPLTPAHARCDPTPGDAKSNGFGWAASKLRDDQALPRLCFVMAIATWILSCQGIEVVEADLRRTIPIGEEG